MKKVKLDESFFYTTHFDFDTLKQRRKEFETSRVAWFLHTSPKQNYKFPKESLADFQSQTTYDYYQEEEHKSEVRKLFENRRSTLLNSFEGKWKRADFYKLLSIAIGPNPRHRIYKGEELILRNYPSGGALYPIKLYAFVKGIEGIEPGAYYISPQLKKLINIPSKKEISWSDLFPMTKYKLDPLSDSADKISFTIFMVVDFEESFKKYGELSERLALFEAGHVAQNLQLLSSYMGMSSLPVCGLFPEEVEKILGIRENENEYCVYAVIFG